MNLDDTTTARQQRYAEAIARRGETVVLKRGATEKTVRAKLIGSVAAEDAPGSRKQFKRTFAVLAADVVAQAFPVPFLVNQDRLVWDSKTLVVISIDNSKRRSGGVTLAYDIETLGPG